MVYAPEAVSFVLLILAIYVSGVSGDLTELRSIAATLPSPVAYWPLSSQFALRDATSNKIDGTWTTTTGAFVTGPFGVTNTAARVTSMTQYIKYQSSLFTAATSWTLASYVIINSPTVYGPILEFNDGSNVYANIWWFLNLYAINYNTSPNPINQACNALATGWVFLAAGYSSTTANLSMFCGGTFLSVSAPAPHLAKSALTAGGRTIGGPALPTSFACTSFFNTTLTSAQITDVMRLCSHYQNISCSPYCATATCRANVNATNGYTCSACLAGWTSADCTVPICVVPCNNGGTCSGPETCTCPAAFTGAGCTLQLGNDTTPYANLLQLRTILDALPSPIAFWPLSNQFALRDATSNKIDGTWTTTTGAFVTGPFGVTSTAARVTSMTQYIKYQSSLFTAATSWTLASYVIINSPTVNGPILEFNDGSNVYANIWWYLHLYTVNYNTAPNPINQTCNALATGWVFLAAGYNSTTGNLFMFCGGTFLSVSARPPHLAKSALTAGGRTIGGPALPTSFACTSLFNTSLSYNQIIEVMRLCSPYQRISCSPYCVTNTCRADATATNGYTCSACLAGWTSPDCTIPVCSPSCQNSATCIAPNNCSCTAGYTGASCQTPVCAQTCNHGGTCTGANVCTCSGLYTGSDCTTPICTSPCQNGGTCIAPDSCSCEASYTGIACQTPVCSPACLNGGNCTMSNVCSCPTGYAGSICQSNLAQLRTLINALPTAVAYWPLSAQFAFRDAGLNSIDGVYVNAAPPLVTGPFGLAQTAYQMGSALSGASMWYISYTSPLLNFASSSSSWTISTFINMNAAPFSPILDYSDSTTTKSHLWVYNATAVYLNVTDPVCPVHDACTTANSWQFVAGIFDASNSQKCMFCNESVICLSTTGVPPTSTTLTAGFSLRGHTAPSSFACTAIYSTALSPAQLLQVKQLCALYQTITCSNNCAGGTCRASAAATNGYTCSACVAGWTSSDCTVPFCSPECQNGATCSAPNTCTCLTGYNGTYCESPTCSTTVCQNGGTCSAPEMCTCPATWTDSACSTPVCSPTCQNGGTCTLSHTCSCNTSYTDSTCSTPVCSPVCTNGGTCIAPNVCACNASYTGPTCAIPVCSPTCQNGGTCTLSHTCSCNASYTDSTCTTPVCSPVCTNGGTCIAPNVCTCNATYTGPTCAIPVCSPSCLHGGSCTAPNTCTCTADYTGSICDIPACSPSCQNGGVCTSPNLCSCNASYTGPICTTPVCSPSCANGGTCISVNVCSCTTSYTGIRCSTALCIPGCSNGGACTSPNRCTCATNWEGNDCSTPICNPTCPNGGTCSAPGTCNCTTSWSDSTCTTPVCTLSCQHGGTCSAPDACTCSWGWQGLACAIPICTSPCLNGGSCTAPDKCTCTSNWTDDTCSTPVCSSRCENGGSCTAPDTCACTEAWKGSTCGLALCHPNCTEVSPVQVDPLSIEFLRNISDQALIANATSVGEWVVTTSLAIVNKASPQEIVTAVTDFMGDLGDQLERYSELSTCSISPALLMNITSAFSNAADTVMSAVTNGTQQYEEPELQDASVKCKISKTSTSDSGDDAPVLAPTVVVSNEDLEKLYAKFRKLLNTMITMVKAVLLSGSDFTYGGSFFAVNIINLEMQRLRGLQLTTTLATVTLPDTPSLIVDYDASAVTTTTTVSASLIAYIANILDVNKPFNMPTITVGVTYNRKKLTLNSATPMKVVGKPVVKKVQLFSSQKVDAQCDISKTKCDLENNADKIGSVVRFPIKTTAGDFMLIFPVIPFNYTTYISFNVTANESRYNWMLYITGKDVSITSNPDYPILRYNYNKNVELRVLVSQKAITKFVEIAFPYGASENVSLSLYIYMKRNLSAFANGASMPSGACDLQRCFGYHLRVGPAASAIFLRSKRDVSGYDDDSFELDPGSNEGAVAFTSNYFGDFGAELVIVPNTIQFSDIFNNFSTLLADNSGVFAVQIVAVVLFCVALVFAVNFDRRDLKEWAFLPISSNEKRQPYHYLISVTHYSVRHYSQKPMVWIRLFGDMQDTEWRLLDDGQRKNFRGKKPANFTLATYIPVGCLSSIELMVNTLVKPPSRKQTFEMYVDKVTIVDVTKARKYVFLVKAKMRSGEMRHIDLPTEDEIVGFRYLLASHSRVGLSDNHPWLSAAQRPLPSNWTRAERLGCVVSALFMAMLVNAMFYGKEADSPKVGIQLGSFLRISWFTVWTSLVGSIIVIPPTTIMAFIFKHIKRRSAEQSELLTIFNIRLPKCQEEDEDQDGKKKKKPFMLPFWTVYISWSLVAVCVGVSAFFVILYSLSWGKEKSLQWLTGIGLHVVQDIIVIQTIKVVIFSIFSSTFLNMPDDGLNIGKLTYAKHNRNRKSVLFTRTRNMIGQIVHHVIYVVTFALVIGTAHNAHSFRQIKDLRPLVSVGKNAPVTDVIADYASIYDWLDKQLVINFLRGNQLSYGGIFTESNIYKVINHDVVLMGPIRIRQQRTKTTSCPLQAAVVPSYTQRFADGLTNTSAVICQKDYSDSFGVGESSEKRNFDMSWKNTAVINSAFTAQDLSNLSTSQEPWIYRETDGPPYIGLQAAYKTGGYYVDLPASNWKARDTIAELRQRRWLDNATTVLFVDFVLYNSQVNIFVAVKVIFEAMSAGGMVHQKWLYPLNLYQYSGNNTMLSYAIQAIWILVLLSHVGKVLLFMKKQGVRKFLSDGWNLFDFLQILLSLTIIGVFAARIYVIIGAITRMQNDRASFVNMDLLVNWEDVMLNLYGIAFFMTMLLFFRHLKSNKFLAIFLGTLSHGKYDLLSFVILFTMITVMFAGLGYGTMGATVQEFRTFTASMMTLVQNVIGVVGPLISLAQTSRFILAFVMAYSSIVTFLAIQVFMTIISFVYTFVARDAEANTNWDAEVSAYIANEWQNLFRKTRKSKLPPWKFKTEEEEAQEAEKDPEGRVEDDVFRKLEESAQYLSKVVVFAVEDDKKQARSMLAWSTGFHKMMKTNGERRPVIKSSLCLPNSLDANRFTPLTLRSHMHKSLNFTRTDVLHAILAGDERETSMPKSATTSDVTKQGEKRRVQLSVGRDRLLRDLSPGEVIEESNLPTKPYQEDVEPLMVKANPRIGLSVQKEPSSVRATEDAAFRSSKSKGLWPRDLSPGEVVEENSAPILRNRSTSNKVTRSDLVEIAEDAVPTKNYSH